MFNLQNANKRTQEYTTINNVQTEAKHFILISLIQSVYVCGTKVVHMNVQSACSVTLTCLRRLQVGYIVKKSNKG